MTILAIVLAFALGFLIAFVVLKNKSIKLEIENAKLQEKINSILQSNKEKEDYSNIIRLSLIHI